MLGTGSGFCTGLKVGEVRMKGICMETLKECVKELNITDRSPTQIYHYLKGSFKAPEENSDEWDQWVVMALCGYQVMTLYNSKILDKYGLLKENKL